MDCALIPSNLNIVDERAPMQVLLIARIDSFARCR